MQRYNISRDGDLMKAEGGYVYLASEVDARIAEITENCTQINNANQTRIDELEQRLQGKSSALLLAAGEIEDLEKALRDIIDPIAAMQRDLQPGYRLDGVAALRAADRPETYKEIARKALGL